MRTEMRWVRWMMTGYFWLWVGETAERIYHHSGKRVERVAEVTAGLERVDRAELQASLTRLRFKAHTGELSRLERKHLELLVWREKQMRGRGLDRAVRDGR